MRRFTLNGTKYFRNSQHVGETKSNEILRLGFPPPRPSPETTDAGAYSNSNLAQPTSRVKVSRAIAETRGNLKLVMTSKLWKERPKWPSWRDSIKAVRRFENSPVNQRATQIEKLFSEGASRLLARATDRHSLTSETLIPRIRAAVGKYLLEDDENASFEAITDFTEKLQADDLCLIIACEQGSQEAWSDLVERFSTTVRSAARSASSNEEGAEDLAQSIWAELYGLRVREDGKPAGKLAYYSGRGSLAGWLRAVVAQLAVDQHRKQSRLVQTEEDSDFDRIIQEGQDENEWSGHGGVVNPELEISEKLAGAEMQEALTKSIKQLSAEDRLLVKLYYFDGLRLREAGAVLGVHEATASRRLTRVHADLRRQVESTLIEEKGWTKPETERAFSDIALHLEADIEPLLAGEGALMNKE